MIRIFILTLLWFSLLIWAFADFKTPQLGTNPAQPTETYIIDQHYTYGDGTL